jgi:hypothetical protein
MDINLLRLSAAIAKMIDDGWQHGEFIIKDHERALRVLKRVQERDYDAALAAWETVSPDMQHRVERIASDLR